MKTIFTLLLTFAAIAVSFSQPLSGNYTVGNNMGQDFLNLVEAAEALQINGANGNVYFYLEEEVFDQGDVIFENIPGWQDSYELGIYGTPGDASKVVIKSYDSVAVKTKNIKNIILSDLTILQENPYNTVNGSLVIQADSDIRSVNINNCSIDGLNPWNTMLIYSNGHINNLIIKDTYIDRGYSNSLKLNNNSQTLENLDIDGLTSNGFIDLEFGSLNQAFLKNLDITSDEFYLNGDLIQNVTLDSSRFTSSRFRIFSNALANLYMYNSVFLQDHYHDGIAISGTNKMSNVLISNCSFTETNPSAQTGAIYAYSIGLMDNIQVSECYIDTDFGIDISADSLISASITNSTISRCYIVANNADGLLLNNVANIFTGTPYVFDVYYDFKNVTITNNTIQGQKGIHFRYVYNLSDLNCHGNTFKLAGNTGHGIIVDTATSLAGIYITNNYFKSIALGFNCYTGININSYNIKDYLSRNNHFNAIIGQKLKFNEASILSFVADTVNYDSTGIFLEGSTLENLSLSESLIKTEQGNQGSFGLYTATEILSDLSVVGNEFLGNYVLSLIKTTDLYDSIYISNNDFRFYPVSGIPRGAVSIGHYGGGDGKLVFNDNFVYQGSGSYFEGLSTYANIDTYIRNNSFGSSVRGTNNAIDLYNFVSGYGPTIGIGNNRISNYGTGVYLNGNFKESSVFSNRFIDNIVAIQLAGKLLTNRINNNNIKSTLSEASHGIRIHEVDLGHYHIFNNMIMGINHKAITIDYAQNCLIEHNTISVKNTISMASMRFLSTTNLYLQNNLLQYDSPNGILIEYDSLFGRPGISNNLYYTPQALDTFAITANNRAISFEEWKVQSILESSESQLLIAEAPFQDALSDLHISCTGHLPILGTATELEEDFDGDNFEPLSRVGADQIAFNKNTIDGASFVICADDSIQVSSEINDAIYRWSTGSKDQGIYAKESGEYTIKSFKQCDLFEQTFDVTRIELPKALFSYETNNLEVSLTNRSDHATDYLWDLGDKTSSFEKNPVHQYNKEGTYTLSLSAINQCGEGAYSKEITLVSSDIQENKYESGFSVYPTACEDWITIKIPIEGNYHFKIIDNSGLIIFEEQVNIVSNEFTQEISNLPGGLYYLIITKNEDTVLGSTFLKL